MDFDELRRRLEQDDIESLLGPAACMRGLLGKLTGLLQDPEPLIQDRAIKAMGAAAERIARDDPEHVRGHLRRLHWMMNEESGSVCCRAPEAMAEIAGRLPRVFPDYIPIICSLLTSLEPEDLQRFRTSILAAVCRLGPAANEAVKDILPTVKACLEDPDPNVRNLAARCLDAFS